MVHLFAQHGTQCGDWGGCRCHGCSGKNVVERKSDVGEQRFPREVLDQG